MSKKLILYMVPVCPPSRAVLLTGGALGLDFEIRQTNIFSGENRTPEYIKLNPQHTVPLLDDDGVLIADSHAICAYLVDKYGAEDDTLYPKDLVKRALVNWRMHFDSSHLFARMRFIVEPVIWYNAPKTSEKRKKSVELAWDILERFLADSPYVCGDDMTIADFCLVATTTSMHEIVPLDEEKHANIIKWIDRLSELPHYEEANAVAGRAFQAAYFETLAKNAEEN